MMLLLMLCLRVVDSLRASSAVAVRGGWVGGSWELDEEVRGVEEDEVFGVEELAHPFTSVARWLCETDTTTFGQRVASVRRALLALSMQHKALKGMDGAAFSLGTIGASAASGSSVEERVSAARDIIPTRRGALRARAAAAARANAVQIGFEAAEACRVSASSGERVGFGDFFVDVAVVEQTNRTLVVVKWAGDAESLIRAVEAPLVHFEGDGDIVSANAVLARLADLVAEKIVDALRSTSGNVLYVGHGLGGSIAALLALRGGTNARAVAIGPAPCCVVRRNEHTDYSVTSLVLGDDFVPRASRATLRRLRRKLRRFLPPTKGGGGPGSFVRFGAAVASSALEHSFGGGSTKHQQTPHTVVQSRDDLHLPGQVFYLKPRADGSVSLNTLGSNRNREQHLWQLNDILLTKSMLAHHTLDAYIHSLERT